MTSTTFDKLLYIETLKSAGIPEDQARAHALDEAMRDSVATKADILRLEGVVRESEQRITIKLGAMLAVAVVVVAALAKLL